MEPYFKLPGSLTQWSKTISTVPPYPPQKCRALLPSFMKWRSWRREFCSTIHSFVMIYEPSAEIDCIWDVRPGHLDRDRCWRMSASSHSSEWSEILGQERRPAVTNPSYYSQSFFHECASFAHAEYGMCLAQTNWWSLWCLFWELDPLVFRDVFVFWTLNKKGEREP